MGVDDDVGAGSVEWRPVLLTEEGILQHERDALVDLGDLLQAAIDVGVDPVGAVGGQTSRGSETRKVVGWLVDWGDGEGVDMAGSLDEVQDAVNGLCTGD